MESQKKLWTDETVAEPLDESLALPLKSTLQRYAEIENHVRVVEHSRKVSYDSPVNFNESMSSPRHRWFPYKEGFSPSFVRNFLSNNGVPSQCVALDPFGGVGTTLLEVGMQGGGGVAFEVSPLAAFIARTKTASISKKTLSVLRREVNAFASADLSECSPLPNNKTVVSYFEEEYLIALLRLKAYSESRENSQVASLFKLAFLSLIEHFSTHRKAGNGQKRRTRLLYRGDGQDALAQVREAMLRKLEDYAQDAERTPRCGKIEVRNESSLALEATLPANYFDCMLTSPPYANCFDYSKIYLCELWLGGFFVSADDQSQFRATSVRSHVHARWDDRFDSFGSSVVDDVIAPALSEQDLWSAYIPKMLVGYFRDIGRMFNGLATVMKSGSPIGVVVSNSVYGGIPVATDLLLADIAMRLGFAVERVEVFRRIVPSSQQFKRSSDKKYFRESMVVFRCP